MDQRSLDELEAAMLKKRLKFLRAQGATGKRTHRLGDDFFKQMEDHWTFCSALADVYAVKEMSDQRRDDAVAATLPSTENDSVETGDLFQRLVSDDDDPEFEQTQ
jgi:hypothetical protein